RLRLVCADWHGLSFACGLFRRTGEHRCQKRRERGLVCLDIGIERALAVRLLQSEGALGRARAELRVMASELQSIVLKIKRDRSRQRNPGRAFGKLETNKSEHLAGVARRDQKTARGRCPSRRGK